MPDTAFILTMTSAPLPGIIAAVATAVADLGGNISSLALARSGAVVTGYCIVTLPSGANVVRRFDAATGVPDPMVVYQSASFLPALISELKNNGLHFRNEMEVGPGGKQIQVEDPDGNPIELFEPGTK